MEQSRVRAGARTPQEEDARGTFSASCSWSRDCWLSSRSASSSAGTSQSDLSEKCARVRARYSKRAATPRRLFRHLDKCL